MRQIRLGFIGCGGHASKNLYPCIPMIDQIDLVATCDLDEEKAKRNCRRFGAKAWYTDYERMIKEQQPDAVAIVGPPAMQLKRAGNSAWSPRCGGMRRPTRWQRRSSKERSSAGPFYFKAASSHQGLVLPCGDRTLWNGLT